MDLSVIIVNFNVKYFLEQCLCSVLKAASNMNVEIFVVDNNSTDGSREYLEERFPGVKLIWTNKNNGFAKANNSVLSEASGAYILFLNPDTFVPEDCFQKCIAFFKQHKNCAALGVHMIDGSGRFLKESKRSFPSPMTSFFKMTGLTALFPSSKLFARYYAGHLPENQSGEVDVLAGAFMMLSKKTLETVKGFDASFFMYGEDIDLSYRIQQSGLKNYYFAGTSIVHFKGESTQKNSHQYIRTFYDAMQLFVSKHYKEKKLTCFSMKIAINLGRLVATARLFFRNLISNNAVEKPQLSTAIVANQQLFDQMLHLVRHSARPLIIKGRIAPNDSDAGVSIGKENNISEAIKKYKLDQLILCEGSGSFKNMISLAAQLSGKTNFLFHANNSDSIVGSNNKNEKGIFIAKP
ncbi:glycosyltransferase family 2 protein [soil metagenome]